MGLYWFGVDELVLIYAMVFGDFFVVRDEFTAFYLFKIIIMVTL
jgi:hypothetical protein